MNICTFGSFFATVSACFAYAACWASVTPCGSPGFVSWPYSVIQTGTAWWNHFFRSCSNVGSVESVTFGKRTASSGFALGEVGYG